MDIFVTVKQVPDPDIPPSHFTVDEAARKVVPPAGVAPVMNGYDAHALEAVGATRAVTDAGRVPPLHQVGLTGATIAPDLYITIRSSGAVQHIAGISGARNVVAINRDRDANIFKYARFGVGGDWKEVVPAFTQRLKELGQ